MGVLDNIRKTFSEAAPETAAPATEASATPEVAAPEAQAPETAEVAAPSDEATANANPEPQNNAAESPQAEPDTATSRFANEELAKVNEFVKRTGKTYDDYKALQVPSAEKDKKALLEQFYSEKEGMTPDEIAYKMKQMEMAEAKSDSDEDDDFVTQDENEILRAKAEIAKDLREASTWWDGERESLLGNESQPDAASATMQRYTAEEYQQYQLAQAQKAHQEFVTSIYSALPDATETELSYSGDEENKISPVKFKFAPTEEYSKELRLIGEDVGVAINKFFKDGKLEDSKGYLDSVGWVHEPTRNARISQIVKQAVLADRVAQSKLRRNVGADVYQAIPSTGSESGADALHRWRESRKI